MAVLCTSTDLIKQGAQDDVCGDIFFGGSGRIRRTFRRPAWQGDIPTALDFAFDEWVVFCFDAFDLADRIAVIKC